MSGSTLKPIGVKEVADKEQRGDDAKHVASRWDRVSILSKTVTEKSLFLEEGEKERARTAAEETVKDEPRINTTSPPSELPRSHSSPLDLSTIKANIPEPLPSALATARIIDDLGRIPYPEGIKSPRFELNINARDGKFIYDRDFLLQFMSICKEKPDSLPALDAIGLEPSDNQINYPMSRGGSGRHRQGSGPVPPQRQNSTNLGFNQGSSFGKGGPGTFSMGGMGNFATSVGGSKLSCDDQFNMSNMMRVVSTSGEIPMPFGGRPSSMGSNRTRSKRGEKCNDNNGVPTSPGSQHGYNMGHGSSAAMAQAMLDPVAPLQLSANRWDRRLLGANDPDSPDVVDRKVKGLLNKLTMEKFDSISDQIIAWANKSEKEKDGRTLIQVIRLVFEKATDEATWSEMYARLCRKMMEQISPKVQDDGIKNAEGKPIAGGQLFRKYLLNRCQEDFERGWVAKEATAAAAASKAIEDQAAKAAAEKKGDGEEEIALYSEEYYAAQKAKRQGLSLIKFIGELFKLQMLTERIMHECVKKLLGNVESPEEEEIKSLCKLLTTVGQLLDTSKARAHMDVYFSRMKELTKSLNVSSRMQFMLQDVLELRERKWISRNAVATPTTLAQIHETAAKEKAAQEKESYQRQMSMSRGGSRRGGDRGDFPQVGADGWAVAGGNSAPRPPSKVGDLSKFGQISNKGAPLTFGPQSSIYAGKKDKRESVQRSNSSSQNMFSMLNNDSITEATPKEMLQRKRLVLQPRPKPVEGQENAPTTAESEGSSDEEVTAEPEPVEISDKDAKKKIEEVIKEFSTVQNLDEAEVYFTQLPAKYHPLLVDKLISFAVESKEADAQLVSDFFSRASTKNLCTMVDFENGFGGVLEFLEDIAIDAPLAFKLMATMMKGPAFDDKRLTRLALKTDSAKLLGLLS
ncbi:ARM repeat-containing protein [Armillaria fumosa]|nr:ARM repeat-containing protein [Armillaria fumosa]